MALTKNCFKETYDLFKTFTHYTRPLSYMEWMDLPSDYRTAVLYVQFYDQITLAWYKLKTDATYDEEVVDEVIKYLLKNTPIIEEDPKRFTEKYIYRIMYNAIYCKSIDPWKGQTAKTSRYNNEVSQFTTNESGDMVDLFATLIGDNYDVGSAIINKMIEETLHSLSDVEYLCLCNRLHDRSPIVDELRKEYPLTEKQRKEVLNSLKVKFSFLLEV